MGYDLHIIRGENWAETETFGIPIDEWLAYVRTDSELELTNSDNIKPGEEEAFENRAGYCEWNAHPTYKDPNARPWFSYWRGSIGTKNPDAITIRKMLEIASALNAKVQGDEGEFYTEESVAEIERFEKRNALSRHKENKPWWKFW